MEYQDSSVFSRSNQVCTQEEIALKSLFLGPQSENADWLKQQIDMLLSHWFSWRKSLFPQDGCAITTSDKQTELFVQRQDACTQKLNEMMADLGREIPKFSPRYVGHMTSEVALPGLLGHLLMLLHNCNHVSSEAAIVSSVIEKKAIALLLGMVGFDVQHGRGHFTSGGTIANIEGLWRARYLCDHFLSLGLYLKIHRLTDLSLFELAHQGWSSYRQRIKQYFDVDYIIHQDNPRVHILKEYSFVANSPFKISALMRQHLNQDFLGPVVLVPGNKHYSWPKAVSVLGLGEDAFWSVELDAQGKMCVTHLRAQIERARFQNRPVLAVVSVAGTTELGEIDPIHRVQELLNEYQQQGIFIWHHIDAAYGGYYCSMLNDRSQQLLLGQDNTEALRALSCAQSVTIDPHKLGYVPYSCGALLVRSEEYYQVSSFAAPYLLKDSDSFGWHSTLEGSRPATGAAATYLAAQCIGLDAQGYGKILEKGIIARQRLQAILQQKIKNVQIVPDLDTNILCFCIARPYEPTSVVNANTWRLFDAIKQGPDFAVSQTKLGYGSYRQLLDRMTAQWMGRVDTEYVSFVRLVLMNPFITSKETHIDYVSALVEEMLRLFILIGLND